MYIVKSLFITVILFLVALNILAWVHASCMLNFSTKGNRTNAIEQLTLMDRINVLIHGISIPRPETKRTPSDLNLDYTTIHMDCSSEMKLEAWLIPTENSNSLAVLYHGYSEEKSMLLEAAAILHELNWNVLLVDFRGSGGSTGTDTSIGYYESDDVICSMSYVREQFKPDKTLILGHSMGAAAVLKAIHDGLEQPDYLIIEAVFDKMIQTTRNRFKDMNLLSFPAAELLVFWGGFQKGFNGFTHNPSRYARAVNCPILFFHGELDQRAHLSDAQNVAENVPVQPLFHVFQNAAHEAYSIRFPEEWKTQVETFAIP